MTSQYIKQFIEQCCQGHDIVVLKGFSPEIIIELGESYPLLDNYIFKKGTQR